LREENVVQLWLKVDPLAEKMPSWSPYSFSFDNPVKFVDPDGREPFDWVRGKDRRIYWDNNATSQSTTKKGETYIGKTDKSVLDYLGFNTNYKFSKWSMGASANEERGNVSTDWSVIDFSGRSDISVNKIKVGDELRVGSIDVSVFARGESGNPNVNLKVGGEVSIDIGNKKYTKTLLPTENSIPEGIKANFTFNPRFLDSNQKKTMDVNIITSGTKDGQWSPPVYHPLVPIPVKAKFNDLNLNTPRPQNRKLNPSDL